MISAPVSAMAAMVWLVAGPAFAQPVCPPVASPPTTEQVQAMLGSARDRGALWTIVKAGRRSWLYGSIHVGNLDMAVPGPKVRQAIAASEVIALELDPGNPATVEALHAQAPGTAAAPPALMERLKALAGKACVPWDGLSTLPPMLIALSLTILEPRWDGLDPSYGTELVLSGIARATGKRVVALESAESQREAMTGGTPGEQQAALEASIDALEQGRVRPVVRNMARAWSDGDLPVIADYERWCDCVASPEAKAYLDRAGFRRNPQLAAAIDALHREGKPVFATVGILHMVGDAGVPRLLEKLGYTVERVKF